MDIDSGRGMATAIVAVLEAMDKSAAAADARKRAGTLQFVTDG